MSILVETLHQTGENRFCECLNHVRRLITGPEQTEAVSSHLRLVLLQQRNLIQGIIANFFNEGREGDAEWILGMLFIDPDERERLTASYLEEADIKGDERYMETIMLILEIMADTHLLARKIYDHFAQAEEERD